MLGIAGEHFLVSVLSPIIVFHILIQLAQRKANHGIAGTFFKVCLQLLLGFRQLSRLQELLGKIDAKIDFGRIYVQNFGKTYFGFFGIAELCVHASFQAQSVHIFRMYLVHPAKHLLRLGKLLHLQIQVRKMQQHIKHLGIAAIMLLQLLQRSLEISLFFKELYECQNRLEIGGIGLYCLAEPYNRILCLAAFKQNLPHLGVRAAVVGVDRENPLQR
ncbi:MAG: hypothetical protein BWY39_01657 [Spirochaetes bacterium ADurb.Bin269]|nr:MAG: hypothetical protein BWY39_01657 [Spirochaetes bacterium ADurb.Bin269]